MMTLKGRILCTEDDPDTRELITLTLAMAGYDVDCTDSPKKALAMLETNKFDLCLLDNWLANESGIELCQRIREMDSQMPVLFYSGAGYPADKERAFKAGARGYLVKPVEPEILVTEVSRLLNQ